MAYTTLADVKTYLGIPTATTADDALITALIADAQAMIDSYCLRTFEASADTTRYFDAIEDVYGRALRIDADLCAVTSVTNGNGTSVTSGQYTTEPRNQTPWNELRLLLSSGVTWTYSTDPEDAITIVGKWAYSTTAPADVAGACKRLAAYLYRQKDNAGDLDRAVIAGNATILPAQIPSDIMVRLAHYKRRTV